MVVGRVVLVLRLRAGRVVVMPARARRRPDVEHVPDEQIGDVLFAHLFLAHIDAEEYVVLAVRHRGLKRRLIGLRGRRRGEHEDVRGRDVTRRVQVGVDGSLREPLVGREPVGHESQGSRWLGTDQTRGEHARSATGAARRATATHLAKRRRCSLQVLTREQPVPTYDYYTSYNMAYVTYYFLVF